MNCSEFRTALDNYASLDDRQLVALKCHAELCEQCHSELEFFESILKTTASVPFPEPPADLIDKVNSRIDNESKIVGGLKNVAYGIRNNARRYSTIAACLVVGIAIGINNGYIKEKLSGDDNGVISEQTVNDESEAVSETDAPTPMGTELADNSAETESTDESLKNTEDTVKESSAEKAASAAKPTAERMPSPSSTPKSSAQSTAAPVYGAKTAASVGNVKTETDKKSVPAVTESTEDVKPTAAAATSDKTENQTASVQESESTQTGRYKIARGVYSLPEEETASVTAAPEDDGDVSNYSLKPDGYQIAMGDYSTKESVGSVSSQSLSDKIIVGSADADAVNTIIGELGISYNSGFYMTSMDVFYELLGKLDNAEISYSYVQQYSSGDKIAFKLVIGM
jgi:hypothetical protein